VSPISGFANTK